MRYSIANYYAKSYHAAKRAIANKFSDIFFRAKTVYLQRPLCDLHQMSVAINTQRDIPTEIATNPDVPKQYCIVAWKEFAPLSFEFVTMSRMVQST